MTMCAWEVAYALDQEGSDNTNFSKRCRGSDEVYPTTITRTV